MPARASCSGAEVSASRILRTIVAVAASILVVGALAVGALVARQRFLIVKLEDRVALLKAETIPLRFMVLSRSDQSVSARFRFYDADGNEIAAFERSWNGSELFIDSIVVPVGGRFLVFPSRVFTEAMAPRSGTGLFDYYDHDGFPAIFDSAGLDGRLRSSLSVLFSRVKRSEGAATEAGGGGEPVAIPGSWGNAVHDLRRFREFEVGAVYSLTARSTGGIEIIRE